MGNETVNPRHWFIKIRGTEYPDIKLYDVLEPNPDAGKSGVCYSGEAFAVCTGLDSKENAYLIAEAPRLLRELRKTQTILAKITNNGWIRDGGIERAAYGQIIKVEALITRLERITGNEYHPTKEVLTALIDGGDHDVADKAAQNG